MTDLGLFWWAPRRSVALVRPEVRPNGRAWIRLALRSGRPLLNFGDELSRNVVAEVTGAKVRWRMVGRADLVAIGSVFELAARSASPIAVWGTGLRIEPDPTEAQVMLGRVGEVLAVRGPKTRDALDLPSGTPLGDPGLLAYRHVKRSAAPSGTVLIPHFTQWNTADGRAQIAAAVQTGMTVVDPSQAPLRVLRKIAAASLVISASLHGVIVAHALGVPAELIRDDQSREPLWKYDDYFASIGQPVAWSTWSELSVRGRAATLLDRRADQAMVIRDRAEELGAGLTEALRRWSGRVTLRAPEPTARGVSA